MEENLYETDFYGWTSQQARLLRSGQIGLADIAEEIETLGRFEARALKACYRLIAMHLLKAIYQPDKATKGWDSTIIEQRLVLADVLEENPGLEPSLRLRSRLCRRTQAGRRRDRLEAVDLPRAASVRGRSCRI